MIVVFGLMLAYFLGAGYLYPVALPTPWNIPLAIAVLAATGLIAYRFGRGPV